MCKNKATKWEEKIKIVEHKTQPYDDDDVDAVKKKSWQREKYIANISIKLQGK